MCGGYGDVEQHPVRQNRGMRRPKPLGQSGMPLMVGRGGISNNLEGQQARTERYCGDCRCASWLSDPPRRHQLSGWCEIMTISFLGSSIRL